MNREEKMKPSAFCNRFLIGILEKVLESSLRIWLPSAFASLQIYVTIFLVRLRFEKVETIGKLDFLTIAQIA